ncbi:sensor histidine kinase [Pedosphaera parvula]|nr:PAS domain S-box protein [Pedosphaera parvula]
MGPRHFFASPTFADEEQTHRAWILHTILWTVLLATNMLAILLLFLLPQYTLRWVSSVLVIDFMHPVLMMLNRRGETRSAGIILIVVLWLLATVLALTGGGVRSPVTAAYIADTLICGLLFGENVGVFAAAFFCLTVFVLAGLENLGYLPATKVIRTSFSLWGTQTFYLALMASYQFLANRSIKAALERARGELNVRRQTEASLRESEQRYREVFETTSDHIFLLDVLPDGRFCVDRWNPAAERAAGISSAELAGKALEELVPPGEARRITGNYNRCIAEKSPISYEESLTLGGKNYDFHTTLIPVKNAEGQIRRIVGVAHDITERKRAVAELQESEDRYRIVVEQTGQMIYDYDVPSGEISWRGAVTKLTGFTLEEFQKVNIRRWEEMIHPADHEKAMTAFHEAMRTASDYDMEYRFRCKDGSYIYVKDHGLFLPGASGKSLRLLGAMADITAHKEAEIALRRSHNELEARVQERTTALQRANKELEAFTYTVSHDLRAPLRAVDGFTDLLQEEYGRGMPEDAQQLLASIKAGSQRMEHLVQDLLNLSRIDRQPMAPRCVDMNRLVREVFEEQRGQQPSRDIELRVDTLPDCLGDSSLLRQVFVNLLSNAIKFTGPREKALIEVGSKTEGDENVYFIRDNGVGFDMKYAGKLFGAFQRLHTAEQFPGTGIGLSIVQRIIHRHSGRIWVESAVDRGTTFYFTLPPYKSSDESGGGGVPEPVANVHPEGKMQSNH